MFKAITNLKEAPAGYPLCFNHQCAHCPKCLHYQTALANPPQKKYGRVVYPFAWAEGECKSFAPAELQELAWGFNNLYEKLSVEQQHEARARLRYYFSAGMSTYYRYHHGECVLSLKRQKDVLDIMSDYGDRNQFSFDHYVSLLRF